MHHAQIAAAAKVSRSTVSRALQNHPSLPAATRRRIQDLAREMGYCPNPLVSALMATRNHPRSASNAATLAVLVAWHPTAKIAPLPTDRRYLTGAKQRAEELGFRFEEFWLDEPGLSQHRLGQILVNRGIVAVLVAPIPVNHPPIELKWEHFSWPRSRRARRSRSCTRPRIFISAPRAWPFGSCSSSATSGPRWRCRPT
ncbi:MAG: LacI family DNA-binding transcriptional regulator [Verrucomicrobiota bacterium]